MYLRILRNSSTCLYSNLLKINKLLFLGIEFINFKSHGTTDITSFGKRLESSLGNTPNFCPNLVQFRFKNMYHKESLTRSSTVILSTN